jgi:hypothetical protein
MTIKFLSWKAPSSLLVAILGVAAGAAMAGCDSDPGGSITRDPGQTDFETDVPGGSNFGAARDNAAPTVSGGTGPASNTATPPSGRTGPVEEADIYRIDQNRLFYLNTYRGFLIFDVNDPKNPKPISRLPVYGYPIEMFVQGNTVYALLRDVLYMTETAGKVQFQRHNVSQLVAIDISDIAHPTILQTVDIVGELREGVSRKIENTIYVVSYIPQAYYWGWRYDLPTDPQKEQAWVYSFNVADPQNLQLVQKLKIFEGGSISDSDPVTGGQVTRYFSDVALSATSNALMVVENWYLSSWSPGANTPNGVYSCGSYAGDQRAVVSLIDISDPAGAIRLHAHFQTRGTLGDQFKQTYVYDDATATGTYYGIFARQAWISTNCSGQSFTQNALESWDVTTSGAPVRLDSLDFGKPNETVRGTAFDVSRNAAFAITAQRIDPLYVLSFADRNNLTIRSLIDGLSGDMSLFRLVEGRVRDLLRLTGSRGPGEHRRRRQPDRRAKPGRHPIGAAQLRRSRRRLGELRGHAEPGSSPQVDWNAVGRNHQRHHDTGLVLEAHGGLGLVVVQLGDRGRHHGLGPQPVRSHQAGDRTDRHQELRYLRSSQRRGAPVDHLHPPGGHPAPDDDQPVRHSHLRR